MGVLLGLVPNHMGVGYGSNPWWQDVLENGRTSIYAEFFDIDWEPLKPELHGKVLLPVLGGQYGEELERGNIQLSWDDGTFRVNYLRQDILSGPANLCHGARWNPECYPRTATIPTWRC